MRQKKTKKPRAAASGPETLPRAPSGPRHRNRAEVGADSLRAFHNGYFLNSHSPPLSQQRASLPLGSSAAPWQFPDPEGLILAVRSHVFRSTSPGSTKTGAGPEQLGGVLSSGQAQVSRKVLSTVDLWLFSVANPHFPP